MKTINNSKVINIVSGCFFNPNDKKIKICVMKNLIIVPKTNVNLLYTNKMRSSMTFRTGTISTKKEKYTNEKARQVEIYGSSTGHEPPIVSERNASKNIQCKTFLIG